MGFVQKGAFNRKAPIMLNHSIGEEIQQFADTVIVGATKEDASVLINIRNFFLSEAEGAMAETGTFIFKAGCYYRTNDEYHFMFAVDTTIVLKSNWDVTKRLEHTASEQLAALIEKAATFNKENIEADAWTYADVLDIDKKEKDAIPVYTVSLPQKGVYTSFENFKMNTPDTGFISEYDERKKKYVFYKPANGNNGKPVSIKEYYAVCDGNTLYFITPFDIYPATKKNGDFYFTGKGKDAANLAAVSTAYFLFGIMGGMIASATETSTFEYRIDHTSGKFLPVRKLSN